VNRNRKPISRNVVIGNEENDSDQDTSRRDLLTSFGGFALSSLLLGQPLSSFADESTKPLTFVITGANSGIGFEACKRLAPLGHRIVMACRSKQKALNAIEQIGNGNLIAAECDLANLDSIKAFTEELSGLIGGAKVDRLCLNAGLARNTASKDCARTVDGFELTGNDKV
jgi:protochlorophyllide reductase